MGDLTCLITNKPAIALACQLSRSIQQQLMPVALEAAIQEKEFYDMHNIAKGIETSSLPVADILDLIGLYISVVRVFMETDEKQFHATLTAVGFSADFIENFPLKHKSKAVSLILSRSQGGIQKLSSFKWRVDISFTCGVLNVKVPPKLIISLMLNNGKTYIFEVDLHTFHSLRFNISLACKEFNLLKSSNVLKNKLLM